MAERQAMVPSNRSAGAVEMMRGAVFGHAADHVAHQRGDVLARQHAPAPQRTTSVSGASRSIIETRRLPLLALRHQCIELIDLERRR